MEWEDVFNMFSGAWVGFSRFSSFFLQFKDMTIRVMTADLSGLVCEGIVCVTCPHVFLLQSYS